jgi:hypothetical protein
MLKTRTVAIYGGNLVMSTLAAALRQKSQFHLRQMDVSEIDIPDGPDVVVPDAIVFDMVTAPPDFAVRCLREHPGILLIGVGLGDNRMLVFSGKQSRFLTVDDLARVLEVERP